MLSEKCQSGKESRKVGAGAPGQWGVGFNGTESDYIDEF